MALPRPVCAALPLLLAALASLALAQGQLPSLEDVSASAGISDHIGGKYETCTIADLDRDGQYDLLLNEHDTGQQFYWGTPGGFSYQEKGPFVLNDFHGAAAGDLDEDGDLDYIQTVGGSNGLNPQPPQVVTNNGDRNLTLSASGYEFGLGSLRVRGRAVRFVDLDRDGLLDVILVNRQLLDGTPRIHYVFHNNGKGDFQEVSDVGAFDQQQAEWLVLLDANDDGVMDVLLMGYFRVWLFVSNGDLTFTDRSDLIPNADTLDLCRQGAEIDVDGDGEFEIYLARGTPADGVERDDVLLKRQGDGYVDISEQFSVPKGGVHTGVTVGDLDNDGFVDAFLSSVDPKNETRLPDLVLMNQGGKAFTTYDNSAAANGGLPDEQGDSAQMFDYDFDGRVDLLSGSIYGRWRLYRNTLSQTSSRKYLLVRVGRAKPLGESGNAEAMGALVTVKAGDKKFVRRVGSAGEGFGQSYLDTLHFGLGEADCDAQVTVRYPSGAILSESVSGLNKLVDIGVYYK